MVLIPGSISGIKLKDLSSGKLAIAFSRTAA